MDINWQGVPTLELIDMFAHGDYCPSMVGKPKIFIIQVPSANIYSLMIKNVETGSAIGCAILYIFSYLGM